MNFSRRKMIQAIGSAIIMGTTPKFLPSLICGFKSSSEDLVVTKSGLYNISFNSSGYHLGYTGFFEIGDALDVKDVGGAIKIERATHKGAGAVLTEMLIDESKRPPVFDLNNLSVMRIS